MPPKNRRRKSPLKTIDKIKRFFAFIIIVSFFTLVAALYMYGDLILTRSFPLKNLEITGNRHYSDTKIASIMGIKKGDCLLTVSVKDISHSLLSNQWIKGVFIRKVLPSTLIVKVTEATPTALISDKLGLFLIDEDGMPLARIKGDRGAYLPLLTGMKLKRDIEKIREAIKLIKSLERKSILTQNNLVRISATRDYGLVMDINGEIVRVGYGDYDNKIEQWQSVSQEVKARKINVVYLDVRFKEQVVIKPAKDIE